MCAGWEVWACIVGVLEPQRRTRRWSALPRVVVPLELEVKWRVALLGGVGEHALRLVVEMIVPQAAEAEGWGAES